MLAAGDPRGGRDGRNHPAAQYGGGTFGRAGARVRAGRAGTGSGGLATTAAHRGDQLQRGTIAS